MTSSKLLLVVAVVLFAVAAVVVLATPSNGRVYSALIAAGLLCAALAFVVGAGG